MLRGCFQIAIQAVVGGKIVARETLKAYRKDVTAKLVSADSESTCVAINQLEYLYTCCKLLFQQMWKAVLQWSTYIFQILHTSLTFMFIYHIYSVQSKQYFSLYRRLLFPVNRLSNFQINCSTFRYTNSLNIREIIIYIVAISISLGV